jgi:hypothetical protein
MQHNRAVHGRSPGLLACPLHKKEPQTERMSGDFNTEQKRYLEGFVADLQIEADPAMALPDRMKLVEGRPLRRRMTALTGQQDCGQCGYTCQNYSDAISSKKEERLNRCVPGGRETTRMLRALHQERGTSPPGAAPAVATPTPAAATAAPGSSRENPVEALFLSRTRLNRPGSDCRRSPGAISKMFIDVA